MRHDEYFQPDTCIPGKQYFIKTDDGKSTIRFLRVKFIEYRPHPAEVIIHDGSRIKVVHRKNLFQKNGRK